MKIFLIVWGVFTAIFIWWRFWFFMRNPSRHVPTGDGFLAPADGYIVYVKRVSKGSVPMTVKKRTHIALTEVLAFPELSSTSGYLIGTFMTAFSVHHNRIPLSGEVVFMHSERSNSNQSTARLMANILLNRKPLTRDCSHIINNDRTTIGIQSDKGPYSITQIADKWISHIINNTALGDQVHRGDLFGMIRFGSQVDVFIPDECNYTPIVAPGQYVFAGESILAIQNINTLITTE